MDKIKSARRTPIVYIPDNDVEINLSNQPLEPPKSDYEDRKKTFRRDDVKKLVGGKYGSED